MQEEVNERLMEMDTTIKCMHEGQTLNDRNIQTMMTKMDLFGRQMERLEAKLGQLSTWEMTMYTPEATKGKGIPSATPTADAEDEREEEWSEDFEASPKAFDAIMSDAESKKRVAESSLERSKKPKSQPAMNTCSRALGRSK